MLDSRQLQTAIIGSISFYALGWAFIGTAVLAALLAAVALAHDVTGSRTKGCARARRRLVRTDPGPATPDGVAWITPVWWARPNVDKSA